MSEESANTGLGEGQLYLFTEKMPPRKIINLGAVKNTVKAGGNRGSFGRVGDREYIEVLVEYTVAERHRRRLTKKDQAVHHHQIVRKEKISALKN